MSSPNTPFDVVRLLEFNTLNNGQQVVKVVLTDKPNETTWVPLSQIDKAKLPGLVAALVANEGAPSPPTVQSNPPTPPATPQADRSAISTNTQVKPEPISFQAPPTPVSPDIKTPIHSFTPDIKPTVYPQISTDEASTPLASRRRARTQSIKDEPLCACTSPLAQNHVDFFGDDGDCMVVEPPPRPPPEIIEIADDEPDTPANVKPDLPTPIPTNVKTECPTPTTEDSAVDTQAATPTTNTTNTTNTTHTTNTTTANDSTPPKRWANTTISTNIPATQPTAARLFRVPIPRFSQPIEHSDESQSPSSMQSSRQSENTDATVDSARESDSSRDSDVPPKKRRKSTEDDTNELPAKKRPKKGTKARKGSRRAGGDDPAGLVKEEGEDPTTRAYFMTLRERPVVHCSLRPDGPETTFVIKKVYPAKFGPLYEKYGSSCHWCRQKTADKKTKCANKKCTRQYCGVCMYNRHQLNIFDVLQDPTWLCPYCLDQCNCSFCFKDKHKQPSATSQVGPDANALNITTNQYVLKFMNNGMLEFGREDKISDTVKEIADWRDITAYYYPPTGLPKKGPRVTCAPLDDVKPTMEDDRN